MASQPLKNIIMVDGQNPRAKQTAQLSHPQDKQADSLFLNFLEQGVGQVVTQRRPEIEEEGQEEGDDGERKKRFEWHGNRQQERGRKDNIQTCITKLANLVPACSDPSQLPTKLNQCLVLKKTTQYIRELEATNRQLMRLQQGAVQQQLVSLRARIHHLKYENQMLRVQLGEAPPNSMLIPPPRHDMMPKRSRLEETPIAPGPPLAPSHFNMGVQMQQMQQPLDLSSMPPMQ